MESGETWEVLRQMCIWAFANAQCTPNVHWAFGMSGYGIVKNYIKKECIYLF